MEYGAEVKSFRHIKHAAICGALGFAIMDASFAAGGLSYADNQVFPHGYIDFDDAGPLAMPDYPLGIIEGSYAAQASYRSLYNIKELTDNRLGFAFQRKSFIAGGALALFGEPDYFQQVGLAVFSSFRLRRFRVGGSLIYSRLNFNDKYGDLSTATINTACAYTQDRVTAYVVLRSINQPRYHAHGQPVLPEAEMGISYKSPHGLDSQAKALFIRHQKPAAELLQAFRVSEYARLSWCLVLAPVRFGGGLHLEKGHFRFDYTVSHHPVLGLTHTVGMTVAGK